VRDSLIVHYVLKPWAAVALVSLPVLVAYGYITEAEMWAMSEGIAEHGWTVA
jgi:hypothetical protein